MKSLPELDEASEQRAAVVSRLASGSHVHISAICGTGTASVLALLKQLGFRVTGSDKAFYPPMGDVVRSLADKVYEGYAAENLDETPDLVVIGNNLSRDNPEAAMVLERGIPYASMPEVFSALLIGTREHCAKSVVVAGTHGKTTTSCMIAKMLDQAGRKPGYFVGGVPTVLPSSIRAVDTSIPLEQRAVVLEGDEYDSAFFAKWPKFHSYRPDIVVMTSLEFDHADIYENVEQIELEFTRLARRVPQDGAILVCDMSERLCSLAATWKDDPQVTARIELYGPGAGSAFRLIERNVDEGGQEIVADLAGSELRFSTLEAGEHTALNLLSSAAVGSLLAMSVEQIAEGLAAFRGVLRRQQVLGEFGGVLVIEDFAHHPTAVKTTLEGLKERYPQRRLVAVFEPRSNTSRRHFFQQRYPESFAAADEVILKAVDDAGGYSGTSSEIIGLDVEQLIKQISSDKTPASAFQTVDELLAHLLESRKPGDVVIVMSNGDFDGLPKRLVEGLLN